MSYSWLNYYYYFFSRGFICNLLFNETYQSHWCKQPSESQCCCRVCRLLERQQGEEMGRKESQSQLVTLCNSLKVFEKHLYANTLTEPLEIKDLISRSHAQECEM